MECAITQNCTVHLLANSEKEKRLTKDRRLSQQEEGKNHADFSSYDVEDDGCDVV